MKEQLISFELAKEVERKNISFNRFPFKYASYRRSDGVSMNSDVLKTEENLGEGHIPTQSMLQKYLREVYKIEIAVQWFDKGYIKAVKKQPFKNNTYRMETWSSYEEALEMALFEGLNLIPDEGNNK